MLSGKARALTRRLLILTVLVAAYLGMLLGGPVGAEPARASCCVAPCCSVCESCHQYCDAYNSTPECFRSCRPYCIGCNPGC